MKRLIFAFSFCVLAAPLVADPAAATRYIVMTRPSAREASIRLLQTDGRDRGVREFQQIDGFAATLTASEVAELRRSPYVRFVSPVVERHLLDAPATSFRPATETSIYQRMQTVPYGIDLVHSRDVWTATRGGSANVNVAILDTGIDVNHPELKMAVRGGFNAIDKNGNIVDDNHHGTHVAGIIAAADNDVGVVGVAPSARLWIVKVLDANGNGSDESLIAGLDWVLAMQRMNGGNWIVSMSLGSSQSSSAEEDAVHRAVEAGVFLIAAAGNSGFDSIDFPARDEGVFAIGAVDSDSILARFSNRGTRLDVVAPGVSVLSTVPLGSAAVADVTAGDNTLHANPLEGSPRGDVTASFVSCGVGQVEEFPASVAGNIAVIGRGTLTFNQKVRNAKAAGAAAVLILGRQTDTDDPSTWTLIRGCNATCDDQNADKAFSWPLTLGLSYADGQKLLATSGPVAESFRGEDYTMLSGTSMATPHVSAVAALLWSLAPDATVSDLKRAIDMTTRDLGKPGYDAFYGFGLVDALAAAKQIAPNAFGLPTPAPLLPPSGRRRGVAH
ncbi:MAG: S8 family serine peptidase [Thermoanaerobaculia bacterium]